MRKVLFMMIMFEMGRGLEFSDDLEMILFNGAKRVGRTMLDCSNSPTAYVRIFYSEFTLTSLQ